MTHATKKNLRTLAHATIAALGLLAALTVQAETVTYDYDPNGNVLVRQSPTATETAGYDALDRLTLDTAGDGLTRQFSYDANGNRTQYQVEELSEPLTYAPQSNRLTQRGTQAITLDASGRVTNDGQYQYTYDHAGRLKQVLQGATEIARYHYNPQGQRTRKTTAQGTTLYHYDLNGQLLLESTPSGQTTKRYLWRDAQPLAQIDRHQTTGTETIVYLHSDHLDTPRIATNNTGTVVWRWAGEAFGSLLAHEDADGDGNPMTINLRYPGQYFDNESGLFYNWNRYYDPKIGRYITSDPIGVLGLLDSNTRHSKSTSLHARIRILARGKTALTADGLPPSINTYAYAYDNPLRYVDPTGLFGEEYCELFCEQRSGGNVCERVCQRVVNCMCSYFGVAKAFCCLVDTSKCQADHADDPAGYAECMLNSKGCRGTSGGNGDAE